MVPIAVCFLLSLPMAPMIPMALADPEVLLLSNLSYLGGDASIIVKARCEQDERVREKKTNTSGKNNARTFEWRHHVDLHDKVGGPGGAHGCEQIPDKRFCNRSDRSVGQRKAYKSQIGKRFFLK